MGQTNNNVRRSDNLMIALEVTMVRALFLVGMLVATGVSSSEAALCKKKNGLIVVRSGCSGKLVPVTAADLGALGAGQKGDQGIQGPRGDKGDQGIQGVQGQKGDKGDQGIEGPKGAQGIEGPKGAQGDQGIQGAKGDKGDQGFQGLQGQQGFPGGQGQKGDKGDKGDTGDQGPPGVETRVVKDANGVTVGTVIDRTPLGAATLPDGIYVVRDLNGVHVAMFLPDQFTIQGVCTLSTCDIIGHTIDQFGQTGCSNAQYFPVDQKVQNPAAPLFSPTDFYVNSAVVTGCQTGHKFLLYGTGAGEHRDILAYFTYSSCQCTSGPFPSEADLAELAFFDLSVFTPPFGVVSVALPAS
jgi:hypothetical protein